MTDAGLVAKKLTLIERYLGELRSQARPERLFDDVKEERFIVHTLQLAIQAALDVASHIVADDRLGEPVTNHDLFQILARAEWLEADLATSLQRMVGFRNVIVHDYADVDLGIVRSVVTSHLSDFENFVAAVRARIDGV
ncbi:MAG: DUF86 domain-containing protein [Acidobacteriota bacterium]